MRHGNGKTVAVCYGKVCARRLIFGVGDIRAYRAEAADVRAVTERETDAHNVSVRKICVRKADVGINVVDRIHPPRAVRQRKFTEKALPVFGVIVRFEKRHGLFQMRNENFGHIHIQIKFFPVRRTFAAIIAVETFCGLVSVRDIRKIERRRRRASVICGITVVFQKVQKLVGGCFALVYRNGNGIDNVAAAHGKRFNAPYGVSCDFTLICLYIFDFVGL